MVENRGRASRVASGDAEQYERLPAPDFAPVVFVRGLHPDFLFPRRVAPTVWAMHVPDNELLVGVAAGDRTAFAAFYDRHSSAVFGLLVKMLPQRGDAEDVLQETFLQVWRQAGRFDPTRSSPFGWLVMLARSRAMDRLRRKAANPTSDPPDRPVLPDAESASERNEFAVRIRRALALLPAEQRAAIDLAFYGGLTYEEVADRQGIPVGTAKTRIRLGMHRLRNLLSDLTEDMST